MLPFKLRLLKRFDRAFGPWLAHQFVPHFRNAHPSNGAVASWKPAPLAPGSVRQILIIRPGGIGDAVLTFPMIRALREHFRDAHIDVLGEKRNVGVYRLNGWVRDTFRYDESPFRFPLTLRRLRDRRYDVVIDTEQYHYLSTIVANYINPSHICGFDTLGRGRFHTHRVHYIDTTYEIHLFLNLAAALVGRPLAFDAERPFLEIDPQWGEWAASVLPNPKNRPIVVIVPGASTPHKYWPPDRYAAVADWLVREGNFVVILGGFDTLAAAHRIAGNHDPRYVLNLAGKTSLAQTAGILQHASLYVSSDTGALHIAYGVGVPTVHMFGSGIMEKWAPPGRRYVVVNKGLPCSPCTRYGFTPPCPYGVACMDAITVDDVIHAIQDVQRR